jgi:hypothetical protein
MCVYLFGQPVIVPPVALPIDLRTPQYKAFRGGRVGVVRDGCTRLDCEWRIVVVDEAFMPLAEVLGPGIYAGTNGSLKSSRRGRA